MDSDPAHEITLRNSAAFGQPRAQIQACASLSPSTVSRGTPTTAKLLTVSQAFIFVFKPLADRRIAARWGARHLSAAGAEFYAVIRTASSLIDCGTSCSDQNEEGWKWTTIGTIREMLQEGTS